MKQEERRQKILNILTMVPIATVLELADQLDVTPETIRKDLTELAAAGEIVRIHGGAALAGDTDGSVPYMAREKIRNQETVDIGRAAAELIDMGDSLILEGSTTVSALCSALAKEKNLLKTLTIVTKSFHIASILEMGELCSKFFFLGGRMSSSEQLARGPMTVDFMKKFCVNKAVLSGAALGEKLSVSAYYENDRIFQKTAMECADQTILLLDSSKYPESAVMEVAHLSDFDYLVTGIRFDEKKKNVLSGSRLKIVEV